MKESSVARVGCIVCRKLGYGYSPAEVHHCRIVGGKRRLAFLLPLCPAHHRLGPDSLHRNKRGFRDKFGSEQALFAETLAAIDEISHNTIGAKPC